MADPLEGRRLCHINLARGYRGGERQTEILVRELADRGVRQQLLVRQGNPLRARCADVAELDVCEVHGRAFGAAAACRAPAIVHAHEAHAFYAAALRNLFFGTPYVLTRRVPNPQKPSWTRRIAYTRSASFVGVSQAVADNVHVLYPELGVTVVPDGHANLAVDEANVADLKARWDGRTVIGHVGALNDHNKGQRTLFSAARRALRERPDWLFVLCGDGEDEAVLREEARELDNVVFAGFVDNPGDYLASFDLFAFPSNFEALGSSLLDAMHIGVPIVASNVDGIPEFVKDGVNGLLVPPRDGDALFESLVRLADDPALRDALVAKGREQAARYDTAAMADAYVEIYRGAL